MGQAWDMPGDIGALGRALHHGFFPIRSVPVPNHPVYQAVTVLTVAMFRLGYFWQARAS